MQAPCPSAPAPTGAIDSRGAFEASLHEALAAALAQRARRMVWVDPDFAGWPLDDAVWLQRLIEAFPKFVWLNPEPTGIWEYRQSIQLIQQILGPERMYPLTLQGLEGAMKALSK